MQIESASHRSVDPVVVDFWSALFTQRAVLEETADAVVQTELLGEAVRRRHPHLVAVSDA